MNNRTGSSCGPEGALSALDQKLPRPLTAAVSALPPKAAAIGTGRRGS
jgi:hypothetical protein